jgi:hypothetical protein
MRQACCILSLAIALACAGLPAVAQRDVPVPFSCTPQVNQKLSVLIVSGQRRDVDNVMVCGITIGPSHYRSGGPHGGHSMLPLRVTMPGGDQKLVNVVVNNDLDGQVTAPEKVTVFAYGQAYFPSQGRFVAGIHDVHCSTHRGADNGWVVVNGTKHPVSCPR